MWCYVSREAWDSAQISGCNHLHRHQFPPGLPWNQILSFSHLLFFFTYLCICVLKSFKDLSSVLVESYTPVVYISPVNSHRSSWESQDKYTFVFYNTLKCAWQLNSAVSYTSWQAIKFGQQRQRGWSSSTPHELSTCTFPTSFIALHPPTGTLWGCLSLSTRSRPDPMLGNIS